MDPKPHFEVPRQFRFFGGSYCIVKTRATVCAEKESNLDNYFRIA